MPAADRVDRAADPGLDPYLDLDEHLLGHPSDPTVALRDLTTLRVGGPATFAVQVGTERELVDEVAAADASNLPVLVLGGGSNVVVGDAGFDGLLVAVRTLGLRVTVDACSGATVEAAAGEPWNRLVDRAVSEGWAGLECLAGIPGLVGASPMQNVGAYGQEVADTIAAVRTYDRTERRIHTFAAADCGFGYRTSRFKAEPARFVVLSVLFQLRLGTMSGPIRYAELATALGVSLGDRVPLDDARSAVLALRRGKGMVLDPADPDTWSAGSFFTNPVLAPRQHEALVAAVAEQLGDDVVVPGYRMPDGFVKVPAGWLIERAGFARGYRRGTVGISTKHTLALTNRGGATTADLLALAQEVRDRVRSRFGVRLEPEPVLVGVDLH